MFAPTDVELFIAEQIQELRVQGEKTSLVWLNSILVKATSPEMAYAKALEQGEQLNHSYSNSDGKTVTSKFRGLGGLFPIHDALEDGAELSFRSLEALEENEILALVRRKEDLDIFKLDDMQEE